MRPIIVDLVRQRQAERHGGGALHLTLTDDVMEQTALPVGEEHTLRVHEALEELAKVDARMAQMVEMRHCAGLNAIDASAGTLIGEDLCGGWAQRAAAVPCSRAAATITSAINP